MSPIVIPGPEVAEVGSGRESLVLDPEEVAVNRTGLSITAGGINVRQEGPDWGDHEIAAYNAQAERGEIPVDFRLPNRKVTIPLFLGVDSRALFTTARLALQTKVGLFQREGGWLKRELADGSVVYLDIVNATLGLGGSTHQAIHELDPDVDLVLETLPDWYGEEETLDLITETTNAEIVAVLEQDSETALIKGDHSGRVRIVVNELDGESQLGLIWGIRSRHYDAAATAQLAYEAEALTPLDSAATAVLSGASGSGSNSVRHQNLSTGWTPVLSTQAVGGAHMTHKGTYRVWARVYSTSGDDVQLRFLWDVGDLALPVENAAQRVPGAANFYNVDLGEVRLDELPVGDHRWQGVIQAKGDAGGENVSIDRVYIVPVDEGYGVLRAPVTAEQGLATFSARDEFNQTAGALSGKTLPVGGTWSGAGDANDFAVETTGKTAQRIAVSDALDVPRVAIAGTTNLTGVCVSADIKASLASASPSGERLGVLLRYTDINNYAFAALDLGNSPPSVFSGTVVAGAIGSVCVATVSVTASTLYRLVAQVDSAGRVHVAFGASLNPVVVAVGQSADLATGGALASGKVGLYDLWRSATAATRNYDNFAAWVPTPDAVLYPNQSAEFRTDGMVREDSAGAAYGPVAHVIGDLPRLPPSGMEERPVELFLKASRGDLDQLPDTGIDDLSVQVYHRPSWLFVPSV